MKTAACAATLVLAAAIQTADAQSYPTKPVRLVVGAGENSTSGTAARIVAEPLSAMWGHHVVVENRPGAGSVPAAEIVAKAAPDGHTLLLCSLTTHGFGPVLRKTLPYDHIKDFTPVSRIGSVPNGLIVHPSLPVKSVKAFITHAKTNPGKIEYGGVVGTSPHITMELFRSTTGINVAHLRPTPGQSSTEGLVTGRLTAMFGNLPIILPIVKEGKVRALAVTSAKRSAQLPETPTLIESGVAGFDVTVWSGLCAPNGVAKPIIAKLNADVAKVLSMPDVKKRYAERGGDIVSSTPEEFATFIRAENARWAKVVKNAGMEPK
jgi:tripartite-type tricarboxylate transporter receptor subunit TctC